MCPSSTHHNINGFDLINGFGHDVRTSLNGIHGIIEEVLQNDHLRAADFDSLKLAQTSCHGLLSLWEDVFEQAYVEPDDSAYEPSFVNIIQANEAAFTLAKSECQLKQLNWVLNPVDQTLQTAELYCDPKLTRRILVNLIRNACRYTQEGTVSLSLNFENDELVNIQPLPMTHNGLGWLLISVRYTGRGFDQDAIEAINKSADGRLSDAVINDLGIGLLMVQNLVKQANGTLHIDAEVGVGTTISVRLPTAQLVGGGKAQPMTAVDTGILKGKSVMVIDDNSVNLKVAKLLLEHYAANVETYESGEKGLKALKTRVPDIILLDWSMPGMSGPETASRIRQFAQRADSDDLIILGWTAHRIDSHIKQEGRRSGMNGTITKPLKIEEVAYCYHRLSGSTS